MATTLERVFSADGTQIDLEVAGTGRPVVPIGGAFNDRTTMTGPAHSLPYDYALFEAGCPVPVDRLAEVAVPVLAIAGSDTFPWLVLATEQVAGAIPDGRFLSLEGQDHGVLQQPEALLPCLREFLG